MKLTQVSKQSGIQGHRESVLLRLPLAAQYGKKSRIKGCANSQALAYAIDRNELVEKVFRGAAVSASAGYLSTGKLLNTGL